MSFVRSVTLNLLHRKSHWHPLNLISYVRLQVTKNANANLSQITGYKYRYIFHCRCSSSSLILNFEWFPLKLIEFSAFWGWCMMVLECITTQRRSESSRMLWKIPKRFPPFISCRFLLSGHYSPFPASYSSLSHVFPRPVSHSLSYRVKGHRRLSSTQISIGPEPMG